MSKKFWKFRNLSEAEAELELYGNISDSSWWGDEVTPSQFEKDLRGMGNVSNITVKINSGGGDVFAAQTIGNMLEQNQATVTARINGLCASAATIIACHCDKVTAAADATYMVHPVQVGAYGYLDEKDLENYLKAVQTIRESIVNLYARKTCRSVNEVGAWMDETTWMTANQAKDNGFVDEVLGEEEEPVLVEDRSGTLFVNSVNTGIQSSDAPAIMLTAVNRLKASNQEKEGKKMEFNTVDELRAAFPDLVNQIETAAAASERQRISDINDMRIPGCEDMANDAMFGNPVAANVFAVNVMKRMKSQGAQYLDNTRDDAKDGGANNVPTGGSPANMEDDFMRALKNINQ